MQRLQIVSNRLPVNLVKKDNGIEIQPSVGGLATGLGSFYSSYDCIWIGWPGFPSRNLTDQKRNEMIHLLGPKSCYPVFLSQYDLNHYYHGFCNSTIWPLFHYFRPSDSWDTRSWNVYLKVNRAFCDAVVDNYHEGDVIWVHDYHLMPLPAMIREHIPDASIGFFLHIPFPSTEIFRVLPWRVDLLNGILGADLIGFHTYDYVRHFISSVRRLIGYDIGYGEINTGKRLVKVDTFPMGIDYERFARAVKSPDVQHEISQIRRKFQNRVILLSFDRLDYTKGIPQRLKAFDLFLEENPEYHEKVVLIVVAVPSRINVREYRNLKREVDELIGKIAGKYGTMDWNPVTYFYDVLPFAKLVALYHIADVALVTPLRDGMNLMAKEFLATKLDGKGALILSEMAGAATELGEAIIVNPFNRDDIARAITTALNMPEREQIDRNRWMQRRLQRYHIRRWAEDFLQRLNQTKHRQHELNARLLSPQIREALLDDYKTASDRLIMLDYDGTLVPFASKPEQAVPDQVLLNNLKQLACIPGNEVVIISGRDRETLEQWFGALNTGIIAEHGIWIKDTDNSWRIIEPLQKEWKAEILPILERYVERTPGSFVEEKEFSLVWHYRNADPDLSATRVLELRNMLLDFIANRDVDILEGNKVLEIKNSSINKGRAANTWIGKKDWDFILAMGDDWTDEYLFDVLPEYAYSIKIGLEPSKARYSLLSLQEARGILTECTFCKERIPLKY